MPGFLFNVAAKLEAHGGKNLAGEIIFATGSKTLIESGGANWRGSCGVDGGENGPAAFSGIGEVAGEALGRGLLEDGDGSEVEEP